MDRWPNGPAAILLEPISKSRDRGACSRSTCSVPRRKVNPGRLDPCPVTARTLAGLVQPAGAELEVAPATASLCNSDIVGLVLEAPKQMIEIGLDVLRVHLQELGELGHRPVALNENGYEILAKHLRTRRAPSRRRL